MNHSSQSDVDKFRPRTETEWSTGVSAGLKRKACALCVSTVILGFNVTSVVADSCLHLCEPYYFAVR